MAYIYFAYDLELNAIKIGSTEKNERGRKTEELVVIGSIKVDTREKHLRRFETAIHFSLRDHAIVGERFYPDKRVVAFVDLALKSGIDAALREFGDDAVQHIGLSEIFMKKSRGRRLLGELIRQGHPTRHYAKDAWLGAYLENSRFGRLVDFLARCPLQEPFVDGKSEVVVLTKSRKYAIRKTANDGRVELVDFYEQPKLIEREGVRT